MARLGCQTATANSRRLPICFAYASKRSSSSAPNFFSLFKHQRFLFALFTIYQFLAPPPYDFTTSSSLLLNENLGIKWPICLQCHVSLIKEGLKCNTYTRHYTLSLSTCFLLFSKKELSQGYENLHELPIHKKY